MSETAIERTEPKRLTVMESLEQNSEKITKALAGGLDPVQFMSVCAGIYTMTPKLKEAPWKSFVLACVEAAQLGLTPGSVLGDCYIVPAYNKNMRSQWATMRIGYRGMMKLIRRGGEYVDIIPELVYENDEFHESKGTKRELHHIPWYCLGHEEGGEVIAAYSTATMRDGHVSFNVITRETIDRAASLSANPMNPNTVSDAWRDHWPSMALKTAIRRHAKFLPVPDIVKEAIMRDEYRDAGIAEGSITVEGYEAEREAIKAIPGVRERREHDGAMTGAWPKVGKFAQECGIPWDRNSRGLFQFIVLWLNGDEGEWPDDCRDTQSELMRKASEELVAWNKLKGDDRRGLCEEFNRHRISQGGE